MTRIVLDPTSSVPEQSGSTVVTTEVQFWQLALSQNPLHIRGKELCQWAESFYGARAEATVYQRPPFETLRDLCPELSVTQAQELTARLGNELSASPELQQLASELFEQPFLSDAPTARHAESYLVWRLEFEPTAAEAVLLRALADDYQSHAAPSETQAYGVTTPAEALEVLKTWLGWGAQRNRKEVFSRSLPTNVTRRLQSELRSRVVEDPQHFETLRQNGADKLLLGLAAEVTAEFYQTYPELLSHTVFSRLTPHLSAMTREALQSLLLVAEPPPVPQDTPALLAWFENAYLPYRTSPRHDEGVVARLGRDFAEIYLRLYASALSGSRDQDLLSWNKTSSLKGSSSVTLLVVLDGLGFADVGVFKEELSRLDTLGRFVVTETALAFSPLPSVTRCSKPALEGGVIPDRAEKQQPIGTKLTSDTDLSKTLDAAQTGDVILWSLTEPDSTYHKHKVLGTARSMAHHALGSVAERLLEHTKTLDPSVPFEIVVTTDHGRLLSTSNRTQTVPNEMQAEGRAATGPSGRSFPETGYLIDGDVAYLDRERYRMTEDAAVVLSSDSFLTSDGRRGTDAFPHGGLFPEEVLVPWLRLARNFDLQPLTARLSGSGEAHRTAELVLTVINANPLALTLEALTLNFLSNSVELSAQAAAMRQTTYKIPATLPTSQVAETATAQLSYLLPTGAVQQIEVEVAISSQEMYAQNNALEDLL